MAIRKGIKANLSPRLFLVRRAKENPMNAICQIRAISNFEVDKDVKGSMI